MAAESRCGKVNGIFCQFGGKNAVVERDGRNFDLCGVPQVGVDKRLQYFRSAFNEQRCDVVAVVEVGQNITERQIVAERRSVAVENDFAARQAMSAVDDHSDRIPTCPRADSRRGLSAMTVPLPTRIASWSARTR